MYKNFQKPIFDFIISLVCFILLSPVFILVSILLGIANRGKIFFCQQRPGKDEQIFKIVKFKTMNDLKDKDGNLLPDKDRLTKIGLFVRKTSLDEIPQLLNIIKGDMSLIGPRPLLLEYLPLYSIEQRKRHTIKPGITGWAQVNGRNTVEWEEKFKLDVWYVNNISLKLDLKIIYLTILKVLRSEGINSAKSVTMDKFEGNNKI